MASRFKNQGIDSYILCWKSIRQKYITWIYYTYYISSTEIIERILKQFYGSFRCKTVRNELRCFPSHHQNCRFAMMCQNHLILRAPSFFEHSHYEAWLGNDVPSTWFILRNCGPLTSLASVRLDPLGYKIVLSTYINPTGHRESSYFVTDMK